MPYWFSCPHRAHDNRTVAPDGCSAKTAMQQGSRLIQGISKNPRVSAGACQCKGLLFAPIDAGIVNDLQRSRDGIRCPEIIHGSLAAAQRIVVDDAKAPSG